MQTNSLAALGSNNIQTSLPEVVRKTALGNECFQGQFSEAVVRQPGMEWEWNGIE